MLHIIDRKIKNLANFRSIILLVFVFVIISIIIFNFGFIPAITQHSKGAEILDNTFNYTPEHVYQLFSVYGDEGRRLYLAYLLIFDFVYPILFALTNTVLLAYLFEHLFPNTGFFRYLYLIPLVTLPLDYMENIGILTLLLSYPTQLAGVVAITSSITMTKLIAVNFLFFITLVAIISTLTKTVYYRLRKA